MTRNKKRKEQVYKTCCKCGELKKINDYYISSDNLIYSDGRLPICKTCLDNLVDMDDVELLIEILRKLDRPFLRNEYEASLSYDKPFGEYMRRLAMPQNKHLTYLDSQFTEDLSKFKAKTVNELNKKNNIEDVISFKATPELIAKWGSGYSEADLYQLETFYSEMKRANEIATPQHIESLKLICKLNLKQNKALDEGDALTFAKLNTQYNKMLQDSGFRPIDKQSGGESIGIRTFSQIWEENEKDGFIEPYPYQEKQDIVDKTIMYMANYTRKLFNMSSLTDPPKDTPKVDGVDDNG